MMTPDLELVSDAGRSALACLMHLRRGDEDAALQLMAGLDETEQAAFAGAVLALASAALDVCDQLSEEVSRATGKRAAKGTDILRLALLGTYGVDQMHD
jgi:hypothetical protein